MSNQTEDWVADIFAEYADNYIKIMARENKELEYCKGKPTRDKRVGYVGIYSKIRVNESH
jgi:hypothetical protein